MIFRVLEGRARPGKIQDIIQLVVRQGEEVVKGSQGLLFLQVLQSGDDMMAVTSWRSNRDMEAYLQREATKAFYRKLPSFLMGIPSVRTFDVVRTLSGEEVRQPEAVHWVSKSS